MPEFAALPGSGVIAKGRGPIPLTGVSIDAHISSLCARVTVTQRYVNQEENPIEAVYVFPLEEGSAVCGFEAVLDDTLIVGEVKEREEAFRLYDEAMEAGHGAFLLDEERPDVFQASLGNLLPGKAVVMKLTYVAELQAVDGAVRFAIPTTVSPRYAPAVDTTGVGRPDSETLNPPVAFEVPYGLNLTVRVSNAGRLERIESPSHPIAVTPGADGATVTLSQRDAALDRDFVLSIAAPELKRPIAGVEKEDTARAIAIGFVPELERSSAPAEIVFLIDRSGSMAGTSIVEVRNALQLCLRSMTAGCRFNIVGFGSRTESLFKEARAYDDGSLLEASRHVDAMEADLGGTELLPALELVLSAPPGNLPRQVVVLTDGEVTNTDAVLALASRYAAHARIFTFGIGAGASHHLVKGLARAGRGACEFIHPGERIEDKVVRQFSRLLTPALTDVRVDWGGLDVRQVPAALPAIFSGDRLIVYGFVSGMPQNPAATVRLTAQSSSGPVTYAAEVNLADAPEGRTFATLAARARIRELEEGPGWSAPRGSRQVARKESASAREIVELSIRYGLMSRETSYVAIERRQHPVTGEIQLRRVPIALTSGWGAEKQMVFLADTADTGDTGSFPASRVRMHYVENMPPLGRVTRRASAPASAFEDGATRRALERLADGAPRRSSIGTASGSGADQADRSPAYALISLQTASGYWELTPVLAEAIGISLPELEAAIAGASGDKDDVRRAWATALALAWLDVHGKDIEVLSRLLVGKAEQWLAAVPARPERAASWRLAADAVLRSATPKA